MDFIKYFSVSIEISVCFSILTNKVISPFINIIFVFFLFSYLFCEKFVIWLSF